MQTSELLAVYIKLRDRRAQRKKAFEAEDESDKGYQDKIESIFLARFTDEGITSVSGPSGTAYISTKTTASVADWDMLLPFIREKEMWQLLTHGVNKTAVEEYVATNEELPPGVNISRFVSINVRRS